MSGISTALLDPPRLERALGTRLATLGKVVAGVGGALSVAGALADAHRFVFSWLTAFAWATTLCLGALFFVVLQHLVRAGWSVAVRRQAEWLAGALPWMALLFLPVALAARQLYPWMGHEAHDPLILKKAAYLNPTFFFLRAGVFFAAWIGLAAFFTRASSAQDLTGETAPTRRMQRWSAPAMVLFALTVTFASFDWLMSLQPHWYSTIFGVYVFAGALASALAAMALLMIVLQKTGLLKRVSGVEQRHDLGKLLFGFTVFWAYIAFCQYMLIWYANIPEETVFYLRRAEGGWRTASWVLVLGHFVVPFVLLLSRAGKRNALVLGVAALLLLGAHYVDLYWLIMPHAPGGASLTWVDLAAFAGPLGVILGWLGHRVARDRLYPIGDPRLHEAVVTSL